MDARPGDQLVIEPNRVGVPPRRGEIVEVLQRSNTEYFRVRWEGDQHESLYFPAPGCHVEPAKRRTKR
jgi:hypothetical protein